MKLDELKISIHALREEGDENVPDFLFEVLGFLSTPSARRATQDWDTLAKPCRISIHALREEGDKNLVHSHHSFTYFYPRPPRGGRPAQLARASAAEAISIHALREEGDPPAPVLRLLRLLFLSTPSARRATWAALSRLPRPLYFYPRPPRGGRRSWPHKRGHKNEISIHALREEGDQEEKQCHTEGLYFYPRPPRGGRRGSRRRNSKSTQFLSTPSARRATPRA